MVPRKSSCAPGGKGAIAGHGGMVRALIPENGLLAALAVVLLMILGGLPLPTVSTTATPNAGLGPASSPSSLPHTASNVPSYPQSSTPKSPGTTPAARTEPGAIVVGAALTTPPLSIPGGPAPSDSPEGTAPSQTFSPDMAGITEPAEMVTPDAPGLPLQTASAVYESPGWYNGTLPAGSSPQGIANCTVNVNGVPTDFLYIVNNGSDNVTVISVTSGKVVANIPVGNGPVGVACAIDPYSVPKYNDILVTNYGSGTISVINAGTNTVSSTVTVGGHPSGVAFDPDWSSPVFFTDAGWDTLNITGVQSGSGIGTITVGTHPHGVIFAPLYYVSSNPEGDFFVANYGSNSVSIVNGSTLAVSTVSVMAEPNGLAYDPMDHAVFVADYGANNVTEISTVTDKVVQDLSLPAVGANPTSAAYDLTNGDLYVPSAKFGTVMALSATTGKLVGEEITGVDGYGIVYDNATAEVYDPGMYFQKPTTTSYTGVIGTYFAVTALTASRPSAGMDANQHVNITANVTGGLLPNAYTWSGLPSGCGQVSATEQSCTPTAGGSFTVSLKVTDNGGSGYTVSRTMNYVVDSDPTATSPSANRTSSDVGQPVTLSTVASGGSGQYSYAWTAQPGLGCTLANTPSISCTSAQQGNYNTSITVTDTNGYKATVGPAAYKVWPDLTSPGLAATYTVLDVNVPDTFQATVTGGSGGLLYSWTNLPGATCQGAATSSPTCSFVASYFAPIPIAVTITDGNGYKVASLPLNVTVHAQPSVTLSENRSVLDENETIQFTSVASSGTPPYHYVYSGLPKGCTSQDTPVLNCTPTGNGTFTVTVNVTDSGGGWSGPSTVVTFFVYPDITFTYLGPDIQWEFPPDWPINESYVGANTGPLVKWTGGDNSYRGCVTAPGSNVVGTSCDLWNTTKSGAVALVYQSPGVYPITLGVEDTTGYGAPPFNATVSWTITIYPLPHKTTLTGPSEMDFGTTTTLVGTIVNGSSPYAIWFNDSTSHRTLCTRTLSPGTPVYSGTVACSFDPTSPGTYILNYTVAYALGAGYDGSYANPIPGTENASLVIQVAPALANLTLSATSGNYSASAGGILTTEVGANVTLGAGFTGGTSVYDCVYSVGATVILNWTSVTAPCQNTVWSPTTSGNLVLTIAVTDAVGKRVSASLTLNIMARLTVSAVTLSPAAPESGVEVNVSVTVSDVLPVISYTWVFGDLNTLTTTRPWALHAWAAGGSYSIAVTVVDKAGGSGTGTGSVTILPGPSLSGMSVQDGPIHLTGVAKDGTVNLPTHTTATFAMNESGGVAPFTYIWALAGSVVSNTTGTTTTPSFQLNFSASGVHDFSLTIWDAQGATTSFLIFVNTTSDSVGPLSVQPVHPAIDVGMLDQVTETFSGGFAPFNFTWLVTTSTRAYVYYSPALNWTAASPGTVSVALTVTDAFHASATDSASIVVNPDLSLPCAPQLTSGIPSVGSNVTYRIGCVDNGTGPYTYQWSTGTNDTISVLGSSITVAYLSEGSFPVSVRVVDALGASATSQVLTLGTYPPTIHEATLTVLSRQVIAHMLQLELRVSLNATDPDGQVTEWRGGTTASLSEAWRTIGSSVLYLNLSENATAATLYFQALDNAGRSSATFSLTMNTTTLTSPPGSKDNGVAGQTLYTWLLVAAILAGIIVLGLYLLLRRRRAHPTSVLKEVNGPKDAVSSAILGKVRNEGEVEEEQLVQSVSESTGMDDGTVRQKLQLLDENHWVVKQREDGLTYYVPPGKDEPAAPSPPETSSAGNDPETNEDLIAALSESAGGVTFRELRKRLGLSEAALSLLLYQNENLLGFRQAGDFGSTRIYIREGTEQVTGPDVGVTFDEGFLQQLEARISQDVDPDLDDWDESGGPEHPADVPTDTSPR